MSGNFTRTVEFARELLKLYQAQGREEFLKTLEAQAGIVADDARGDAKEINSRFVTMIFGMLSVLYVHEADRIIRKQLAITANFLNEPDPGEKVRLFIADLGAFLQDYEAEKQEHVFSARILLHLSACSQEALRKTTVASLAEKFGYHPNYLSNKFKKEQGITLQEALLNEKMNRGFLILKDGESRTTVKEVSWELGFADAAYFSQLFKRRFGMLPTEVQPH
jgi:AraC-like DNA-binding protein